MDSAARIGRTGPAGDEGDSRAAGHLAVGVGHVGDPAFLPADDEVDLFCVVERIEDREEALARHRKDAVAALDFELIDKNPAAGALGHGAADAAFLPSLQGRGWGVGASVSEVCRERRRGVNPRRRSCRAEARTPSGMRLHFVLLAVLRNRFATLGSSADNHLFTLGAQNGVEEGAQHE